MKDIVLVTGSSGLIGGAVAQRLTAADFEVIGLDNDPPEHAELMKEHVHLDFTKDDSVQTALRYVLSAYGPRILSVVHLAAYVDFSGEPSPLYENVTVRGTERLLRELENFDVGQFVFSSTMLVHAPSEKGQRINEDWPLDPNWDYPKSKVETERLLHQQRGAIPLVILRLAGVYDDRCHSIPIANQIQRVFERRLISHVFPGDTSHGQAFVHLDDAVECIALLIDHRGLLPADLTLLVGEAETLSYETLQLELGRLIHGEVWDTQQIPKAVAKAGAWLQDQIAVKDEEPFIKPWMIDLADEHYELDTTRARSTIGWEPRHSLRATLPRMIEALRADPLRFYRENELDTRWLELELGTATTEKLPHAS